MSGRLRNGVQDSGNRRHIRGPVARPRPQRATSRRGEAVELGAFASFGRAPFRLDGAALFEPVEGGVQRAVDDPKGSIGAVANEARDGVAVHRAEGEGPQDQHVEGALEEVELTSRHGNMYNI